MRYKLDGMEPGLGVSRERAVTAEVSLGDYQALAELRHLIRQFLATSEGLARSHGLTPQQHQLMLAIAGRAPEVESTVGYLAERLSIQHNSAVGLVDRLAAQGLIERETGAADRRQVIIRLTERGAELLRELSAGHRAELRLLAPRLVAALGSVVSGGGASENQLTMRNESGGENGCGPKPSGNAPRVSRRSS